MNPPIDTPTRVRRVLLTRPLTLYQVSRRSAQLFGRRSPYYVPEYFYAGLATGKLGPSIHQLIALSRISGYRLSDWLAVFGFALDDIPRLQMLFPRRRTVLVDSSVYDENQWIPWFAARSPAPALSAIAPLAQALQSASPARARQLLALNTRRFLYAKIGREDIFAFPDLAAGSIARIDPLGASQFESALTQAPSRRLFAVETAASLHCGHLRRLHGNRVALCSTSFASPSLELTLGRDAKILGVVDAEIRPAAAAAPASPGTGRPSRATTSIPPRRNPTATVGQLIRRSRIRAGLSFREASSMSRSVASVLADRNYFASPGTLSDYDRLSAPPRQIQKLLSLCILYGIGFWDLLGAAELALDPIGNDPMPDELCGRASAHSLHRPAEEQIEQNQNLEERTDALSALIREWREIPLFIRSSLPEITRLPHLSLWDFFSVGPEQELADPLLANAALVTVNRRLKKPVHFPPPAPLDQPLYLLLKRDGGYLCASCSLERGVVALDRHPPRPLAPLPIEGRADLEVIGQVTAILRRLP